MMETTTDEIAPDVFRFSTFIPDANIMFNQFVVRGEESLLFHTGPRALFPLVSAAVERVAPLDRLRWITFGHVEADECGAMNEWLAAAPRSTVAQGAVGCMVSLNDLADRPPRALADGEVLDIGGHCMRWIDTAHVPHGWDAGLLYDETTRTLLCGDLFTRTGAFAPTSTDDLIGPAVAAEDLFRSSSLAPQSSATVRRLADLDVATLALMHGPAFTGDCRRALADLADDFDKRIAAVA
jgi:flavorubredoxin